MAVVVVDESTVDSLVTSPPAMSVPAVIEEALWSTKASDIATPTAAPAPPSTSPEAVVMTSAVWVAVDVAEPEIVTALPAPWETRESRFETVVAMLGAAVTLAPPSAPVSDVVVVVRVAALVMASASMLVPRLAPSSTRAVLVSLMMASEIDAPNPSPVPAVAEVLSVASDVVVMARSPSMAAPPAPTRAVRVHSWPG